MKFAGLRSTSCLHFKSINTFHFLQNVSESLVNSDERSIASSKFYYSATQMTLCLHFAAIYIYIYITHTITHVTLNALVFLYAL